MPIEGTLVRSGAYASRTVARAGADFVCTNHGVSASDSSGPLPHSFCS